VIEREPDWTALPAATPAPIRTLLRRCLQKDPRKRAPHIGLARLDVDDVLSGSTTVDVASGTWHSAVGTRQASRSIAALVAGGVLLAVAAAAAGYFLRPRPTEPPIQRSLILIDENMNPRAPSHRFSISPDGRRLAYAATGDQSPIHLWVRPMSELTSQPVAGTDNAMSPFWSPESALYGLPRPRARRRVRAGSRQWETHAHPTSRIQRPVRQWQAALRAAIATMDFGGRSDLTVIDLTRQVPYQVTRDGRPIAAVWSRDGRTLYYSALSANGRLDIYRRRDLGNGPEELVFDSDVDKYLTSVSEDERKFIYGSQTEGGNWDIFSLTLPTREVFPIAQSTLPERGGQLSPNGQLIAFSANTPDQAGEVYIARYPAGTNRIKVSTAEGGFPRWLSDRELAFYDGRQLLSAAVTVRPDGIDVGAATPLFPVERPPGFSRIFYDTTGDGRFLLSLSGEAQLPASALVQLTNWPAVGAR
jgi:hypothetical protein